MATLFAFGDESGTMPLTDVDSPFVTAIVAWLDDKPSINSSKCQPGELLRQLSKTRAILSVAFVKPHVGYGERLSRRLSRTDTMARVRRLIDGSNRAYYPAGGVAPRNQLWVECMHTTIGLAAVRAAARAAIDIADVVLDEKTLPRESRHLLTSQLGQIKTQVRAVAAGHPVLSLLSDRLGFAADSRRIRWSDDPTVQEADGGLLSAHVVAHHFHKGLGSSSEEFIEQINDAFPGCTHDLTDLVTREISPKVIARWERETGLRAPS